MKTKELIAVIVFSLLSVYGLAQDRSSKFSFELTAGPSIANRNLGGADLNLGGGFETIFHYQLMPHAGVYAGWGWNKFSADQSFAGNDMDFEETGYVFGLQFKHPFGSSAMSWFLRAGGLYNHIEIENPDGKIVDDTGHGFGVQFAGGIDIPLSNKWSFTPGFKVNSLTPNLDNGTVKKDLNLNYDSARIGFVYAF